MIMEQSHSLDIDTMIDFQYAQFLISQNGGGLHQVKTVQKEVAVTC